ncbi:MAG: hypothetical protein IPP17_30235 [Bacteroidetes bacterium]|nr:hypothetical protein [Bacteroidota bacterium]
MNGQFDLLRSVDGNEYALGEWPTGSHLAQSTQDRNVPVGLIRYELYHTDVNGNRSRVATDEVWNAANGDLQPRLGPISTMARCICNSPIPTIGIYN